MARRGSDAAALVQRNGGSASVVMCQGHMPPGLVRS
jgi:hypothetical protein